MKPIGIISALPEEIEHLKSGSLETVEVCGLSFHKGKVDGRDAVLVETGIGKVNAAIVTTLLIERFDCRGVLFSGVAGGLDPALSIGDVVIGKRVVQHDYGRLQNEKLITFQPGAFPLPGMDSTHGFEIDDALMARAEEALDGVALKGLDDVEGAANTNPRVVFGTILTGDSFVNCEATRQRLHDDFKAQAVEMEGAAVAQVATQMGRPWLIVRCLSDLAGAESHMDFNGFLSVTTENAASVTRRLVEAFD